MKDKLQIQLTLETKEKDYILKAYKDNSISMAGRVLNLIRKDVKKIKSQI